MIPEALRYSEEHEWVRVEGGRAVIGITDYAQDALGDIVYVGLPDVGLDVLKGATVCEVESTKSVSEIYAPLTGKVAAVNELLTATPEQCNADPYGHGWIFALELADPSEVEGLLDAAGYATFVEA